MTAWRLPAAACPLVGLGGGMVDEFIFITVTVNKNNKNNNVYCTLKREYTKVSYTLS